MISIPLMFEDKETIKRARQEGKALYPEWKKTEYKKPRFIKSEFED